MIIRQNEEAHLGSDLVEGPGQKVGGAHPDLEGPKRVFDGLSSHAHGLGHVVEPILHGVKDAFVFPALDPLHFLRGALRLERTGKASGQMTVLIDVARAIGSDPPPGQVLAGRAGLVILLGVVDEVLPGDLVAVEVAAVGQGGDCSQPVACCALHAMGASWWRSYPWLITSWATIRWCSASTAICTL